MLQTDTIENRLPFEPTPLIQSYQFMAYPLGIIQANTKDDIMALLCGRYINCLYLPGSSVAFDICPFDRWFKEKKVLLMETDDYTDVLQLTDKIDYVRLFKERLTNGWYINLMCNEEYIPEKRAYKRWYYRHDLLLTGYDDRTHVFLAAGYLKDGFFHVFEIPYILMQKAITTLDEDTLFFKYYKYNNSIHLSPDYKETSRAIWRYLTSTGKDIQNAIWGINAVKELGEYFLACGEKGEMIDLRYTKCLVEHKFLMIKRLDYLKANGFTITMKMISNAKEVYQIANRVHQYGLKYSFKTQPQILKKMASDIEKMCSLEYAILPELLNLLESER